MLIKDEQWLSCKNTNVNLMETDYASTKSNQVLKEWLWRAVVDKVHRSSTWVKVQIRIIKYYSSKSKSTAFSILLEWKYKSTRFFYVLK